MLYAFKFFLILTVGVSSIYYIYLSQHVGPSAPDSENSLGTSTTSRIRRYRSPVQLQIPDTSRDFRPSFTSLQLQIKGKGDVSLTSKSAREFTRVKSRRKPCSVALSHKVRFNDQTLHSAVSSADVSDNANKNDFTLTSQSPPQIQHQNIRESSWLNILFYKTPVNDRKQNTALSNHEISDKEYKSDGQTISWESLHATTDPENKEGNSRKKTTEWRRRLVPTSQQSEKQNRRRHLIQRRYISTRSRSYIHGNHRLPYFSVNSRISHGEDLPGVSHSSADNVSRPGKSLTYNRAHEENTPCVFTNIRIDCSSRQLTDVPTYKFPDTVTAYLLFDNNITCIKDSAFKRYSSLELLDLSRNKLCCLPDDSFVGLRTLRHLNLSHNDLRFNASNFPADVFAPLGSLEILWIHKNNPNEILDDPNMTYPDAALSNLINLTELYMDGLQSKDFGPGFRNLTKLHTLSLSGQDGNCRLGAIKNTTFVNVTTIRYLRLQSCGTVGDLIEANTFSPLTNLTSLILTDNYFIGFQHLNYIFYGLRNTTTLKYLSVRHIVSRYTIGICLDSRYLAYFPKHLERLDVGDNALEGIDRDVIAKLSPSLNTLDVGANAFAFGTYLMDLPKMNNLTTLLYNGYCNPRSVDGLPKKFPSRMKSQTMPSSNCSLYEALEQSEMLFQLPPNLKYVEMNEAGLMNRLTEFSIDPNNKLESLSMYGNYFPKLIGPITGLLKLKYLFLNANNIRHISADFFRNLTSLEDLDLSSNLFETVYDGERKLPVFLKLQNLKMLNLSYNEITKLHVDAFDGLVNLKELYLRGNRLEKFTVNMSHIMELEMLDLSNNLITVLPLKVTEYIDSLQSLHGSITLNLAECHIHCSCDNFKFLRWFSQSEFKIVQGYLNHYRCTYPDNTFMYITDRYNSTFAELSKECASNYITFLVTGATTLFVFCVIFVAIIYRFRWNLRYFYYAAYLRYKKVPTPSDTDYEFDVFVSYAEEDSSFVIDRMSREFERRGLKVFIHGRDFAAGEHIASNIVNAVGNCRKTLVVLTRNMVNSYWCRYEVQMANMECVQRGKKILIFLLMGEFPESELGVELLYNIRNNTYIPYPETVPDDTTMSRLWDKLVADIKN